MAYKLIASDLDGTLLGVEPKISKENLDAIEELSRRGVLFVPSTGRCFYEIPEALRQSPAVRYYITSNGACTYDKVTDTTALFSIRAQKLKEILAITEDYDVCYTAHRDKEAYFDHRLCEEDMMYYTIEERYRKLLRDHTTHLEDVHDFLADDKTEMIVPFFHNMDERRECLERLKKVEGISLTASIHYNIEIISGEATKGNALLRLQSTLGIEKNECLAIGDSDNDLTMFAAAGRTLATKDASAALKQEANDIICAWDEHVVEYTLKHCF